MKWEFLRVNHSLLNLIALIDIKSHIAIPNNVVILEILIIVVSSYLTDTELNPGGD